MKLRPTLTITIVCFTLFSSTLSAPAIYADGGGSGGIGNGEVSVGVYYPIPGSGEWASVQTGIPDDPMEYKFELKCFDEDVGSIECLYENRNECKAAAGGRLVYWFTRLKGDGNAWAPLHPGPSCIYSEKPRDIGDQIRESILSEFQSRPIAPSVLTFQPSPYTLVGAHTHFYVAAGDQTFDFQMLEQNIRIVARPTEYEWDYGDGLVYGPTPLAGAPLPEGRWGEETPTSHVYRETGDYQARVVVYFSGEFSINGGPMVPIEGRAAVPSAPQTISVWKSESRNVADDCIVNPAGFGC